MFRALVNSANRLLHRWSSPLARERLPDLNALFGGRQPRRSADKQDRGPVSYQRLRRVVLADEVCRNLFCEFEQHRRTPNGEEETGWTLLGIREADQAVALATLPAGANRDAGRTHVRFNSAAQSVASRIVRQWEPQLTILGVVHTHPGSMRHPSDGDYNGDSQWVGRLRGGEGVFAIGTADVRDNPTLTNTPYAVWPEPNRQVLGQLCFSWYALADGDSQYRPIPVELTIAPDLASPLRKVWKALECHAPALERLAVQQRGIEFGLVDSPAALSVTLPLAEPKSSLRALLTDSEVAYYVVRGDQVFAVDPKESPLDRALYLILAELAATAVE